MLKQLFSRKNRRAVMASRSDQKKVKGATHGANPIEQMESRLLLSSTPPPVVLLKTQSITTDNRGFVEIVFNQKVKRSTINTQSVKVFTAGKDNAVGTKDDVAVSEKIFLNKYQTVLTIQAKVATNETYRVFLNSKIIKDTNGRALDGEFNGVATLSGNGKAGGDLNIRSEISTPSLDPVALITTNVGTMLVNLFLTSGPVVATPIHASYFLDYVNDGIYDNNIITRSVPGTYLQMGALSVDSATDKFNLNPVLPQKPALNDEHGNSNVAGTVAFALSQGPTTARNEFFFNVGDNTGLDNQQGNSGPFTPFGNITDPASLKVLKKINNLGRLDLSAVLGNAGVLANNVPVVPKVQVTGSTGGASGVGGTTTQSLSPSRDFIIIERIAVRNKVDPIA